MAEATLQTTPVYGGTKVPPLQGGEFYRGLLRRLGRWVARGVLAVLLAAWCCGAAVAQTGAQGGGGSGAGGASQPPQSKAGGSAGDGLPTTAPGETNEENHARLTKDQAKELFKSVDEILTFVSGDTDLTIEHSVKRKLITRDEVNKFLRQKFDEDEGAKRLEREEIVLKKFGLLDRDFHLRPFMISLLTEQVAGFYDNKTKTVNLLDWIAPEEQKPVLAHELTHALQDQTVNLTKWSEVSSQDIAKNVAEDNRHIQTDEADTARDAVAEGQATAVYLDYSLKPMGRSIVNTPEMLEKMKESMSDTTGSPVMARAPLLLQESLTFPYSEGLSFEGAVLLKKGKDGAFGDVLKNPPGSSYEIMTPAAYMAHAPVPVLAMPDIHPLIDGEYTAYDVGVMGEFDVKVLTELFGGEEIAEALAPNWAGGIYYAAQRRSAVTAEAKESTGSIGLLYESKWKNADSARTFLRVYSGELARKYTTLVRRTGDKADGGEADDEQVYTTNEGDVLLSREGSGVFVSEGFPVSLARKLRDLIGAVQSEGPLQVAGLGGGRAVEGRAAEGRAAEDLGMRLVREFSSAGVMKVGLGDLGRYTLVRP
ncbi:MAG: hypothetical protein ABR910_15190 [Acidobacteriaceae bacterium]